MTKLHVDWCSYEAAKYAIEKWHYSRRVPAGKRSMFGVWEDDQFVGCVMYGSGAAPQIHCPFGIERTEICELVRVALTTHKIPVTRIIAITLKMLKKAYPKLRVVVSFADTEQGHIGGIYQGGNWIYVGTSEADIYRNTLTGKKVHPKTIKTGRRGYATQLLTGGALELYPTCKHKYVMPLDDEMRHVVEQMRKPYPKHENTP